MQIKVRFVGLFRRYTGEQEKSFEIPEGSSAGELLLLIGREYGPRLPRNLWDDESGRFHRSIRLARSNAALAETDELRDGDEIVLLFALAGG